MTREKIFEYVQKKYGTQPEYLWMKWPDYAVLRHERAPFAERTIIGASDVPRRQRSRGDSAKSDNDKWYAIIMNVSRKTLGLEGDEEVDILDVKCDPTAIDFFQQMDGFLPAYHMSKTNWITLLLDGSVPDEQVLDFVDASYAMTEPRKKK